jgi:hypothetical protein
MAGREVTKGAVTPAPKVALLPTQTFICSKTLAMGCVHFTITTPIRLTGVLCPVLGRKTSLPPNHLQFAANPTHATAMAMHFPANTGLIFLTDELTNDRYLVDTGATLSLPCSPNSSPSGPLLVRYASRWSRTDQNGVERTKTIRVEAVFIEL